MATHTAHLWLVLLHLWVLVARGCLHTFHRICFLIFSRRLLLPTGAHVQNAGAYEEKWGSSAHVSNYHCPTRLGLLRDVCRAVGPHLLPDGLTLDLGCGSGLFLELLSQGVSLRRHYGMDVSRNAVQLARCRCPIGRFVLGSVGAAPFASESVDCVLCTEVLEHVADPAMAIREIWRILVPGGIVLLTVPDGVRDRYGGHRHFWDMRAFRRLTEPFKSVRHWSPQRGYLAILARKG